VQVQDDVETVNGGIRLAAGARIGGGIDSVNGGIHMSRAVVGGDVENVNGDLTLEDGSVVVGSIRYH
jgi:DUF4097 and DUF4098 domain-containing protein YvlB